jgi:cytochrome P450
MGHLQEAAMKSTLPPGPRTPGFVMLYLTQRRTQATLESLTRRYGDVFTVRLIRGKTLVFASDPGLVEAIFTADDDVLVPDERGLFLLGAHSVMTLHGAPHAAARTLLMPAFDREHVDRYRAGMEQVCSEEFGTWPVGERFQLFPRMERITISVVINAVCGLGPGVERETLATRLREVIAFREDNPVVAMMINVAPAGSEPPKRFMRVRRVFDDEIYKQIERARADPRIEERDDTIATLLQTRHPDGTALTDEEIRDHVATLLIQGHGSAATSLAWCIERLVRHPDCLERLRSEVGNGTDGEYLEAVIIETLRLRPPIPVVARVVAKPFRFAGYELPAGTMVAANALALHRREELYPDPLRFDPERWLGVQPVTYTWIPFGGGVRHCLGRTLAMAELKYVLGRMIQEFDFEQTPGAPDEKMRRRGIGWIPDDGTPVVIRNRVPAAERVADAEQPA